MHTRHNFPIRPSPHPVLYLLSDDAFLYKYVSNVCLWCSAPIMCVLAIRVCDAWTMMYVFLHLLCTAADSNEACERAIYIL